MRSYARPSWLRPLTPRYAPHAGHVISPIYVTPPSAQKSIKLRPGYAPNWHLRFGRSGPVPPSPRPCPPPGSSPPFRWTVFVTPPRATKVRPTDGARPHVWGTSLRSAHKHPSPSCYVICVPYTSPWPRLYWCSHSFCWLRLSVMPTPLLLTIVIPPPEFIPPAFSTTFVETLQTAAPFTLLVPPFRSRSGATPRPRP